jgi:hypothetical protein
MEQYIVWVEYTDGRNPGHWVFNRRQATEATQKFADHCGVEGVEFALLTFNGNTVDSWGT